jgi:hypothetical protein
VLITLISFLLVLPSATAIRQVCGNAGNYTAVYGTYLSNLASLVAALSTNISSSSQLFANAAGQAPDAVYALALCRGDITSNLTRQAVTGFAACVNNSFGYVQKMCPYAKAASVYDDDCLLGFSNSNILVPANNITRDDDDAVYLFWLNL